MRQDDDSRSQAFPGGECPESSTILTSAGWDVRLMAPLPGVTPAQDDGADRQPLRLPGGGEPGPVECFAGLL